MVNNNDLDRKFRSKKYLMSKSGKHVQNTLAFRHVQFAGYIEKIVHRGLSTELNSVRYACKLGKAELGCYLSRYFDVEVQRALDYAPKNSVPIETLDMFIFRYVKGKVKKN